MGVVVRNVVVDGGGELGHTATNAVGGYFSSGAAGGGRAWG